MSAIKNVFIDKQAEVVLFSSTAVALYGYDQGMMSLINTNKNYLATMGVSEESVWVAIIVAIYYLGCAVGAVAASWFADVRGRKPSIFACLATTLLGNLMMFISGLGWGGTTNGPIAIMMIGRTIMGLGVGGIDAVIPTYSSELNESGERGAALAKEFQANVLGLNIAFALNLFVTINLGKENQWAWRIPIIAMNIFPAMLMSFITRLPESPRWCISQDKDDAAKEALVEIYGEDNAVDQFDELKKAAKEESSKPVQYFKDMLSPSGSQFHPTMVTVMGQVNQALTGYGAVSVYGPQIFELLGFEVRMAEYLTLGNYLQYFFMMTFAWLLIDRVGRRSLMLAGSAALSICFILLTICGGLSKERVLPEGTSYLASAVPGSVFLYIATAMFGIGWLPQPWLIPTEIYPSTARAQGAAVSVIVWGIANFAVTFLTPPGFNNLNYWLFLVFAATNIFAGWWTWQYSPESGGRSFEENQQFFEEAKDHGTWNVRKICNGEFLHMPGKKEAKDGENTGGNETSPLLSRDGN